METWLLTHIHNMARFLCVHVHKTHRKYKGEDLLFLLKSDGTTQVTLTNASVAQTLSC